MLRPLPSRRPRHARGRGLAALAVAAGLVSALPALAAAPAVPPDARPASPPLEEHVLATGIKVLLLPRHLSPTGSCGWVAHVGPLCGWRGRAPRPGARPGA